MNKQKLLVGVLMALSFIGCGEKKEAKANEEKVDKRIPVLVQKVVPSSYREDLVFYGKANGYEEATLMSYEAGKVQSLKVNEGDRVSKGKYLCNIEANLNEVRLKSAEIALKMANDQLRSAEKHLAAGSGSQLLLDKSSLDVYQAEQNVIQSKKIKNGSYCLSPISGTVAKVHIKKYQDIQPGSPTITIINDSKLKVKFGIPETQIHNFKRGKEVIVYNPLNKMEKIEVPIVALASIVEGSERNYTAEVVIMNKNNWFLPGQTALIETHGIEKEDAMVIPTSSLLLRKEQGTVMVNENGIAVAKKVNVISSNATHSLVSGELKFGAELIVEGQTKVIEGSSLIVKEK